MNGRKLFWVVVAAVIVLTAQGTSADVTKESSTQMEFKGMLGTMMKTFGADKPSRSAEYYKGNLFRSDTIDEKGKISHSQIIDLEREVFISIDHEKRRYTEMTFDEWREMMEGEFEESEEVEEDWEEPEEDTGEVDWELDIDVSRPGDKETIAGMEAEKVVVTLTMTAKVPEEESGEAESAEEEMKVTSSQWLAQEVEGYGEIETFQKEMAEKLGLMPGGGFMESITAAITQSNPGLAEAMQELQEESGSLAGVALRVHTVYESEKGATMDEKATEEEKEIPKSVGGFLKGFGKKAVEAKKEEAGSGVLLETTTEITRYEVGDIASDRFEIPEGYELKEE